MKWTCKGDVRGGCGIIHRTREAAGKCCDADHRAVKRGHPSSNAYSDRHPVPVDAEARRAEERMR
jgi:hypothetical protein